MKERLDSLLDVAFNFKPTNYAKLSCELFTSPDNAIYRQEVDTL